ncbi:MAG: hypothetical protein Homavirus22_2 [Homavirus sp.]|uniref:AN1-type domain-containing protein n=1 Tax=Homavirus sp. TaxID=2487769 RepID=A0A3G5A4U8_9VIRU|nr:MAG: hypothetical protein Homavirus22_2 [Homavirus sp.]
MSTRTSSTTNTSKTINTSDTKDTKDTKDILDTTDITDRTDRTDKTDKTDKTDIADIADTTDKTDTTRIDKQQLKNSRNRCAHIGCNARIGTIGFTCKCELIFCLTHRLPEIHDCDYDHKLFSKAILQSILIENKIVNSKLKNKI